MRHFQQCAFLQFIYFQVLEVAHPYFRMSVNLCCILVVAHVGHRLNMCTPCGNAHCTLVAVFHKWLFRKCWQHVDILGSAGVMVFLTSNSKINSRSISFWINWKDGIAAGPAGPSMYLLHASVTASPSSPTVIQNLSDFVKEYILIPKKEIYLRMKIIWCTPDSYLMSNPPLSVWLLE